MRRQSKKRAALIRIYMKRRAAFLDGAWCLRCGGVPTEIHHKAGRVGAALLDESRWAALCSPCHRHVTDNPAEAVERGWSLPRIGRAS